MIIKKYCVGLIAIVSIFSSAYAQVQKSVVIEIIPTPLVYQKENNLYRRICVNLQNPLQGKAKLIATVNGLVTNHTLKGKSRNHFFDIKVPDTHAHKLYCVITNNTITLKKEIIIKAVRPWIIFCAPFTHVDIGFTQSQRNIRLQNLKNLDIALNLVEETKHYGKARFKLFTEVSWAVIEYLEDPSIPQENKNKLIAALKRGDYELGAFLISHQNRFMSPEAIIASLQTTYSIAQRYSIPISTACIHDVMDFSKVTKILCANNIPYLLIGPNDSRYIVPPLFYLTSHDGSAQVLVWHSVGLNGYGENFDLNMRLSLPFEEEKFMNMENAVGLHLAQIEEGYPTSEITKYFDYEGKRWNYPFDAYLLPYYPAQGGDNQPQNIVPSEIVKAWNKKFVYPKMIIATPAQFFQYVSERYANTIPRIKGEMPAFWGEQIYLDFIQVDPQRLLIEYAFAKGMYNAGSSILDDAIRGKGGRADFNDAWMAGYKAIILNNDHNPRPVPFGKTHYTSDDVKEWMDTRNQWVKLPYELLQKEYANNTVSDSPVAWEEVKGKENIYTVENTYYRTTIDIKRGIISKLYDKDLKKEWIRNNTEFGFNQYVQGVRGENAAKRNYFTTITGFSDPTVAIYKNPNNDYKIIIKGKVHEYYKGMELLSEFLKKSFDVKLPPWFLKCVYYVYQFFTPSLSLTQEIIIPSKEKKIELVQQFTGTQPQIAEHYFVYPLDVRELYYDTGYTPLKWGSVNSGGDCIPAAKNIAPFKSINDTLYPFQWMYGIPPSFHFDTFVMAKEGNYYAVFTSPDAKAIIPEISYSRDDYGFYHCCIGWTLWGRLGLGRSLDKKAVFRSVFTSFAADTKHKAMYYAYKQAFKELGYTAPQSITISNSNIIVVWVYPVSNKKIICGLFETSGLKQEGKLEIATQRIKQVYFSTCEGANIRNIGKTLPISLTLQPHQLTFIALELN